MKYFMLTWLPITAAVMAWLLLTEPPTPSPSTSAGRQVRALEAADSSGHDRDGIIQGNVVMGLPGHDGASAYSFTDRDSWVQVPSVPALNPRRRDFLVSAWVRLSTEPGPGETYDVIRKGLGFTHSGEYKLEVLNEGWVRCSAKDKRGRLAVVTGKQVTVTDGAWHRIGCARVGGEWGVLVDGTATSRPVTLGPVKNTVALAIGSKYGFEDRPEGLIDDVKFTANPWEGSAPRDFATVIDELEQRTPAGWWRLDETATSAAQR